MTEYPDREKIMVIYYKSLFGREQEMKDNLLNKKLKLLQNPDKIMCSCFRVLLKKNYEKHILCLDHIKRNNIL